MKKYTITGWYRYGSDEKDFETETVFAESSVEAIEMFKKLFINYKFYSLHYEKY